MKKLIIIVIILLLLGVGGYYYYSQVYIPSLKPTLNVEENSVDITEYYIYGTTLNMTGQIKKINAKFKNIDLILWNTKDGKILKYKINYKTNVNKVNFNINDEINNGIYLDNIKKGTYHLYLRFSYKDKDKTTYKYYPLNNKTTYKETTYYTTSNKNNKLTITTSNKTMSLKVKSNPDEVYDIVLDPSGGGVDQGSIGNGTNEATITLAMANKVKEKLEAKKIKVKLTRDENSLEPDEYFDEYNKGGRAVISHEVNAKYVFSFQASSSTNSQTKGFSIYTAANIDYDFATKLVENIVAKTNQKTSSLINNRIDYGIYTHNFTEREIQENLDYYDSRGYKHYNVTTNSNYLYMIRETGGIMTGAYVDDSNPEKVGVNPYYNSNVGAETYIIDLGYLTNQEDINILTNNQDAYAEAIANTIINKLKI